VGGKKFLVIGVLDRKGKFISQSLDSIVIVPMTTYRKCFASSDNADFGIGDLRLTVKPVSAEKVDEAMDQLTDVLRRRRHVPYGKPNDFELVTEDSFLSLYRGITKAFYLVMILISSIALVVGGIGVMNIMLVSVKERTREIGVRKAIGARRSDILWQFLIEAMTLTGVGGILGIALGIGIGKLVDAVTPLPSTAPLWSIVIAFCFSVGIGLFFGIYPAVKAARLDPIEALRYE
jgi:putative ABC transport system permease protein